MHVSLGHVRSSSSFFSNIFVLFCAYEDDGILAPHEVAGGGVTNPFTVRCRRLFMLLLVTNARPTLETWLDRLESEIYGYASSLLTTYLSSRHAPHNSNSQNQSTFPLIGHSRSGACH